MIQTISEQDAASSLSFTQYKVSGSLFECLSRYSIQRPIGKGAYGLVCSAADSLTGDNVAVKKIANVFESPLDARRTLREIRLLRRVCHENIVTLRDCFPPPSIARKATLPLTTTTAASSSISPPSPLPATTNLSTLEIPPFCDIYLVYDLMDTDLHQLIRSAQLLPPEHIRFFAYQLLRGLAHVHSAGVVHRDLKPSNLLINANCDLKICDFGLARIGVDSDALMAEYVVTRWYRAPELILSCCGYGSAIDMWSVGCIVAEMLGRKPLFPGRDFLHTLSLICKVVGRPNDEEAARIPGLSERSRTYLKTLPRHERPSWEELFPSADPLALDLLDKLLVFDPAQRLTAAQALSHPWFAPLHDVNDESILPEPLPSDPEVDSMDSVAVRAAVLSEMAEFNPELRTFILPPPPTPMI